MNALTDFREALEVRQKAEKHVEKIESTKEYKTLVDHAVKAFSNTTQLSHLEQIARSVTRFGDITMWVKRQTGKAKKDDDPWIHKESPGAPLLGARLIGLLDLLNEWIEPTDDTKYAVLMETARLLFRDLRSEVLFRQKVQSAQTHDESNRPTSKRGRGGRR